MHMKSVVTMKQSAAMNQLRAPSGPGIALAASCPGARESPAFLFVAGTSWPSWHKAQFFLKLSYQFICLVHDI